MTHEEIVLGVRECVARVIDKDVSLVHESDCIIADLGADSLDLLDLIFQLEQRFKIKISPRGIERAAQERLGDVPLEVDGIYTLQAIEELRKALPEIPESDLCEGLVTSRLPRLFRVATFVNLTERLLEAKLQEAAING